MQLLLDDREDQRIVELLAVRDVEAIRCRLEYGDCSFEGNGPKGRISVGIERKHLGDVITSMHSRRLTGHQLSGMFRHYDYSYLLVEDIWRPMHGSGGIEVFRGGKFTPMYSHGLVDQSYQQVSAFLNSLAIIGGVTILRSSHVKETVSIYHTLLEWWNKPYESHHSLFNIYAPGPDAQTRGKVTITPRDPGIVEMMAAQLPGVDQRAWAVGDTFATPADMVLATEQEWEAIEGIGRTTAQKVVKAIWQKP